MLFIRSPYLMLAHPLFRFEAHRVRWGHSQQSLQNYTLRTFFLTCVVVFTVWALLLVGHVIFTLRLSVNGGQIYTFSRHLIDVMIVISFLADAFLDFVSLGVSIHTISQEKVAGRWDLLRLTALNERGIVAAKHAGVRLRVWRFTTIIASARLAVLLLWLFATFILPYAVLGTNTNVNDLIVELMAQPFSTIVGMLVVLLAALVFVVEPFWRMQALTALGMVISAYVSHVPTARLAALGVMLLVWLLQIIVIIALIFGVGLGLGGVLVPFMFGTESALPALLFLLGAGVITSMTIYGFYSILQTWSLRRVSVRIAKDN